MELRSVPVISQDLSLASVMFLEDSVLANPMSLTDSVTDVLQDFMALVPKDVSHATAITSALLIHSVIKTLVSVIVETTLTDEDAMNVNLASGITQTVSDVVVMDILTNVTPRLEFVLDAEITQQDLLVKFEREASTETHTSTKTSLVDHVLVQELLEVVYLMQTLVNFIPKLKILSVDAFLGMLARDVIDVTTISGEVLTIMEDHVSPVSVTTTSI